MAKIKTKLKIIFKYCAITAGTLVLMGVVYYGEKTGEWLKATLLEPPQPFDGTTLPIQRVPNWTRLRNIRSVGTFDSITEQNLVHLPVYDPSVLTFPDAELKWDNPSHEAIRNAKITYPVVYMGNYKLDHEENGGSHLAIDIKVPVGTPIYALANGRVEKASIQKNGFGHHVIIKHPDAPDPDNATKKTALYSIYAHMSDVYVSEGQNVLKGMMIGRSGQTGTATSAHLHFQIDRDTAPWHPFWPFSWKEEQEAGLSFFEAINAGLGRERALQYSINPLLYAQKHLKPTEKTPETVVAPQIDPLPTLNEKPSEIPAPIVEEVSDTDLVDFHIYGEHFGLIGSSINIYVEDQKDQLKSLKEGDNIPITLEGAATLSKRALSASDFINNVATLSIRNNSLGNNVIQIGKSQYEINFIESAQPVAGFRIRHKEDFILNTPQSVSIEAINAEGRVTPVYSFNGVISLSAKKGNVRFNPEQLTLKDFKEGSATVRVTIKDTEAVVIRAQNGALVGESETIHAEKGDVFSDIKPSHRNFQAIKFLKENKIISGYADGSFKPQKTVNRAEALKMLMLAFDIKNTDVKAVSFKDVNNKDWYASFLATALQKGIVAGYADGTFKPDKTVNRAEYLKILFKTNNLEASQNLSRQPYSDVPLDAWFAPYAFLANKKNILPLQGDALEPLKGMTRAEVAETIYRMKMIEMNNWLTYDS